jgi:DNA-binding NtrC family response regulator
MRTIFDVLALEGEEDGLANILLVDDDPGFTSATAQLLGLLEHDVTTADTVAAAAQQLQQHSYDRVFLDLMLPDGSGLQLLDHIPSEATRVTVITGHPAVKAQVMNLYGTHVNYLVKPITLDQLKRLFAAKTRHRGPVPRRTSAN